MNKKKPCFVEYSTKSSLYWLNIDFFYIDFLLYRNQAFGTFNVDISGVHCILVHFNPNIFHIHLNILRYTHISFLFSS